MLNKIFLILLAVSVVVMSVLVFFCHSWLSSVDKPSSVADNLDFYAGLAGTFLWISSLALLVFANVVLWKSRSVWSLWAAFCYFAVFTLLTTFWLGDQIFAYKKANGLTEGFTVLGLFGAILCVVVGIGVFFDQFIVLRMRDKLYNKPQETPVEETDVIETESDKAS